MNTGALLDHVGQLVGQEMIARSRAGPVFAGIKNDVFANGISLGIDCARGVGGARASVNSNAGKILTETRFEIGARSGR